MKLFLTELKKTLSQVAQSVDDGTPFYQSSADIEWALDTLDRVDREIGVKIRELIEVKENK